MSKQKGLKQKIITTILSNELEIQVRRARKRGIIRELICSLSVVKQSMLSITMIAEMTHSRWRFDEGLNKTGNNIWWIYL